MRNTIFCLMVTGISFTLMSNSSCSKNKEKKQESETISPGMQAKMDTLSAWEKEQQGFVKATIMNNTGLDGCGYMLVLDSGKQLIPLNLSEAFMKDKMRVWVQYTMAKDAMTVCMAGEAVNVVSIEER